MNAMASSGARSGGSERVLGWYGAASPDVARPTARRRIPGPAPVAAGPALVEREVMRGHVAGDPQALGARRTYRIEGAGRRQVRDVEMRPDIGRDLRADLAEDRDSP